jgi:fatty acid desaturase
MNIMSIPVEQRDYSLTGYDGQRAVEIGLASAEWYHSDVPRKLMKELMQRSDGPALRDTALWFALLLGTAAGGIWFWGSWPAVPFFLAFYTAHPATAGGTNAAMARRSAPNG